MGSSGINSGVHGDCTPTQCPVTMLRPLLLLVPCLLALGWDMDDMHARGHLDRDIPGFDQEFEDMEDELEDDFEEDRSLNDDFDEHADDMGDLEDLTPEEVEDREAILDDREGRLAGPIVRCGRWTNRVVELDGNTTAKFESTKITNRCTVLYKPTNFILVVLHFGRLQFWSSSILVVFHFGRLPFWLSSILVVFHFGRLPFWSSSILVVFHFGRLPFWSSSILVVFRCGIIRFVRLGHKI